MDCIFGLMHKLFSNTRRWARISGFCVLWSLTGFNPVTAQSTIDFTPCRIGIAPMTLPAECASVDVPFTHGLNLSEPLANASTATGQTQPATLSLSVARIPARSKQTAADPITLIAGGPGQGAQASWPQLSAAFYPILANRDVYLIDQRGTGNSSVMKCPTPPPGSGFSIDLAEVEQAAHECHNAQTYRTEWFTTSVAVRDLDTVRESLGIEQWNLYGVSYGTRVALHYLRRFPKHTASLILDAVVPPQKPIGPELPLHSQQSLDALFERCEMDTGCAAAFPNLAENTEQLFASLKANAREVEYENLSKGALESLTFTDQHLAMSVRLLSYTSYGTAILPSMLHDAAVNENLAPFARQVAIQESQLGGSLATGMHAAVICTEDAPFIQTIENRDELKKTFLGDYIVDAMVASCKPWPEGIIDDDFHEAVTGDVPVLALSGAADPITPPEYAELAITHLTNARHIVNPHQAHTQAPLGCTPSIMSQFVETKNPAELSLDCLQRLSPPALFVDANGPLP